MAMSDMSRRGMELQQPCAVVDSNRLKLYREVCDMGTPLKHPFG